MVGSETQIKVHTKNRHNYNECTGVQNPHRYMHAYIAWITVYTIVHVQYQEY